MIETENLTRYYGSLAAVQDLNLTLKQGELIRDNLALLNSEQAVTVIASFLPYGLFLLLMFAMLGVGDVMHQLCLTSDLELLMIAPVPYRTIFLVKLMQCSWATFIPAFGFGALLLALGLAWGATVTYYILIALLIY